MIQLKLQNTVVRLLPTKQVYLKMKIFWNNFDDNLSTRQSWQRKDDRRETELSTKHHRTRWKSKTSTQERVNEKLMATEKSDGGAASSAFVRTRIHERRTLDWGILIIISTICFDHDSQVGGGEFGNFEVFSLMVLVKGRRIPRSTGKRIIF